eukprot:gene56501-56985_t
MWPFGMLPVVVLMGDPMQLAMPKSTTVFKWLRMFKLLPERETPAAFKRHGAFPVEDTVHIAHMWEFLQ